MPTHLREIGKEHTADQSMVRLQDRTEESIRQFTDKPELDTILIENIKLTGGIVNNILHRLDREPRGYYVVRQNAICLFAEHTAGTNARQLSIVPTTDVTASLVVF